MILRVALWAALACAVLYGIHRLAIRAEERGWIYYRKGHGTSWSAGAAALELQSLLHPASRHVAEQTRRQELERDESERASDD